MSKKLDFESLVEQATKIIDIVDVNSELGKFDIELGMELGLKEKKLDYINESTTLINKEIKNMKQNNKMLENAFSETKEELRKLL